MPCGEHDNASIANLLAIFLKKHGLKKNFHPLLHCKNNKEWEWGGRLSLNQKLCVMVEICDNDCRFRVMGHEMRTSEKTENELVDIEDVHFLPEMLGLSGTYETVDDEDDIDKQNIKIGTFGRTQVVRADFESESMKGLLHSMATKGEFQVGIKIVNSNDGPKKTVRFVHWLSALVKKLNAKRKEPPDWEAKITKKMKS